MGKAFLEGVKVIDFTGFLSGPYCGMYLADLGADVTVLENSLTKGTHVRYAKPINKANGRSMYFGNLNRNKRGIAINLKSDAGKEIMERLIKQSDVLIENMRPGVIAKLGFSYERCKEINPKIIMASISGFGQEGKYSSRPGYDLIAQAQGGAMSVTGWPNQEPTRSGLAIGDMFAGLNAAIGIISALYKRNETGEGAHIDVSLVDTIISAQEAKAMEYIYDGHIVQPQGNKYSAHAPYDSFEAKDTHYVIASGTDKHFIAIAIMMGMPELIDDERFHDTNARNDNSEILKDIINNWSSNYTAKECVEKINEVGVPAAEIYNMEDVYNDDYYRETRDMFPKVPLEDGTFETVLGNPIHIKGNKVNYRRAAPNLAEHNEEVLKELGYSNEDIDRLKENGAFEGLEILKK